MRPAAKKTGREREGEREGEKREKKDGEVGLSVKGGQKEICSQQGYAASQLG